MRATQELGVRLERLPPQPPRCAQCNSPMVLASFLPTMRGRVEANFRCNECGLAERMNAAAA